MSTGDLAMKSAGTSGSPAGHAEQATGRMEWLRELWNHRELLYFLAWRDVKVRYKQAALGAAWAVLQPLVTMLTFAVVFGRLAHVPSDGVPYPLFSYCALVLWLYFSVTIGQGSNSLVSNATLLTKVYFPRVLLPAATALAGLMDLAVSGVFLVVLLIYYKVRVGWIVLLAPLFVLQLIVLVVGLSMLLSALNVRYRDVKYTVPFLTQIGLFVTPIIYPTTFLPPRYQGLLALNPLAGIVDGFRGSVLAVPIIDWRMVAMSWIVTLVIFASGIWYFRHAERLFADIV